METKACHASGPEAETGGSHSSSKQCGSRDIVRILAWSAAGPKGAGQATMRTRPTGCQYCGDTPHCCALHLHPASSIKASTIQWVSSELV